MQKRADAADGDHRHAQNTREENSWPFYVFTCEIDHRTTIGEKNLEIVILNYSQKQVCGRYLVKKNVLNSGIPAGNKFSFTMVDLVIFKDHKNA